MVRQASLILADEIYYNLYGKAILQGIYSADIAIPANPSVVPQLIFYFMAEADVSDPFHSMTFEVTFPEGEPIRHVAPVLAPEVIKATFPGRKRLGYRYPFLVQAPTLRPGKIEAKLIHEKGEIEIAAPWIAFNHSSTTVPKVS
jgi:hypothetical protein